MIVTARGTASAADFRLSSCGCLEVRRSPSRARHDGCRPALQALIGVPSSTCTANDLDFSGRGAEASEHALGIHFADSIPRRPRQELVASELLAHLAHRIGDRRRDWYEPSSFRRRTVRDLSGCHTDDRHARPVIVRAGFEHPAQPPSPAAASRRAFIPPRLFLRPRSASGPAGRLHPIRPSATQRRRQIIDNQTASVVTVSAAIPAAAMSVTCCTTAEIGDFVGAEEQLVDGNTRTTLTPAKVGRRLAANRTMVMLSS